MLREQYMKNLRVYPMLQTKMADWEKEKQGFEAKVFYLPCCRSDLLDCYGKCTFA